MKEFFESLNDLKNSRGAAPKGEKSSKGRRAQVERLEDRCLLTVSGMEAAPVPVDDFENLSAYTACEIENAPIVEIDLQDAAPDAMLVAEPGMLTTALGDGAAVKVDGDLAVEQDITVDGGLGAEDGTITIDAGGDNAENELEIADCALSNSGLTVNSVSISGAQRVGATLTAKVSTSVTGLRYQWYVSDSATGDRTAISGAVAKNYTVSKNYLGKYITVVVTKNTYQAEATTDAIAKSKLVKPTVTAAPTDNSIRLTWNSVPGASSYDIQYKKIGDAAYTVYGSLAKTSYTLTGLESNTTYTIRVRAVGNPTYSEKSDYAAFNVTTKKAVEVGKPSAIKQTSARPTSVAISWTAASRADYYNVNVYNAERSKLIAAYDGVKTTSLKIDGLEKSTSYAIDVVAVSNSLGSSKPVAFTAKTSGILKLNKPSLTVTPDANSLKLKWTSVANAAGYQVSYKAAGDSNWTLYGDVAGISCSLQGLKENTSYTVRVKALGDAVNYNNSDNVFVVAPTGTGVAEAVKLAKPSVEVKAVNNTLNLSWGKVNGAQTYQVQYKAAGETAYTNFGTTDSTSCSISGLKGNTEYSVRVRAVGDAVSYKNSDYSAPIALSTGEVEARKLVKPVLTGSVEGTTLNISWAEVANAKGYQVQYKLADSSSYVNVDAVSGTSCSITGLAVDTNYVVRVKALGDGEIYLNSDNGTIALTTASAPASALLEDAFAEFEYDELYNL